MQRRGESTRARGAIDVPPATPRHQVRQRAARGDPPQGPARLWRHGDPAEALILVCPRSGQDIPRAALLAVRLAFVEARRTRSGRGRRPLSDGDAKGDDLTLHVTVARDTASVWSQDVSRYLDQWPAEASSRVVPAPSAPEPRRVVSAVLDGAADPPQDRRTRRRQAPRGDLQTGRSAASRAAGPGRRPCRRSRHASRG